MIIENIIFGMTLTDSLFYCHADQDWPIQQIITPMFFELYTIKFKYIMQNKIKIRIFYFLTYYSNNKIGWLCCLYDFSKMYSTRGAAELYIYKYDINMTIYVYI